MFLIVLRDDFSNLALHQWPGLHVVVVEPLFSALRLDLHGQVSYDMGLITHPLSELKFFFAQHGLILPTPFLAALLKGNFDSSCQLVQLLDIFILAVVRSMPLEYA